MNGRRLVAIIFLFAFVFTLSAFASNRTTLEDFLVEQGVCIDGASIRIVTNFDNSQHIEVYREISDGEYEVSIISCVEETNNGLFNKKLVTAAPVNSKIVLSSNRTSQSFVDTPGNSGITVTVTAYYNSVSVFLPESIVIYQPSGVTGKVQRSSGNNTVTQFQGYFTIPGELVTSDYTLTGISYNYQAIFTQSNPSWNVIYSAYQSLPSNYPYIDAINPSIYDSPGLGYVLTVAGTSLPYQYSVCPF